MYQYCVITKVPEGDRIDGNLAIPHLPFYQQMYVGTDETNYRDQYKRVDLGLAILTLRQEVFLLGEILITDRGGREVVCRGRKPSKWSVEYKEFETLEDAVRCSQEVTNEVTGA